MVADKSDDELAKFIDQNASMILVDYGKLDFPSLLGKIDFVLFYFNILVYLCQRRGTKEYIGTMFKVCKMISSYTTTPNQSHDVDGSGEISQLELQAGVGRETIICIILFFLF